MLFWRNNTSRSGDKRITIGNFIADSLRVIIQTPSRKKLQKDYAATVLLTPTRTSTYSETEAPKRLRELLGFTTVAYRRYFLRPFSLPKIGICILKSP